METKAKRNPDNRAKEAVLSVLSGYIESRSREFDTNNENFRNWCEDGDVFYHNSDMTPEERNKCIELMCRIEDGVDEINRILTPNPEY